MAESFPSGIVVFFRILADDNKNLARSVHPTGREVIIGSGYAHHDDYVVLDKEGGILGYYPREFVSAIIPISSGEPVHAPN